MDNFLSNVKIGVKIYGLIGILLFAIAAASGSGMYQMSKIGDELHAVTTQDMPLTTILTTITTHQLEQAILFERGVSIGARLATDPSQKGHFVEVEHELVELGHKVEAEMKEGEELLADAVEHATSDEARKEFEHLLSVIKKVEVEHHEYELLSVQALGLMEKGEIADPGEVVALIEAQETKIDHELEEALVEIEKFTESALNQVESHEKSGMILSLIIAGIAIALGLSAGVIVVRGTVTPINAMTLVDRI